MISARVEAADLLIDLGTKIEGLEFNYRCSFFDPDEQVSWSAARGISSEAAAY
jgi:hypothetical protein